MCKQSTLKSISDVIWDDMCHVMWLLTYYVSKTMILFKQKVSSNDHVYKDYSLFVIRIVYKEKLNGNFCIILILCYSCKSFSLEALHFACIAKSCC